MREIVLRVQDVPADTREQIKKSFEDIARILKEDKKAYDGILISVTSGRAYVYEDAKEPPVERSVG